MLFKNAAGESDTIEVARRNEGNSKPSYIFEVDIERKVGPHRTVRFLAFADSHVSNWEFKKAKDGDYIKDANGNYIPHNPGEYKKVPIKLEPMFVETDGGSETAGCFLGAGKGTPPSGGGEQFFLEGTVIILPGNVGQRQSGPVEFKQTGMTGIFEALQ